MSGPPDSLLLILDTLTVLWAVTMHNTADTHTPKDAMSYPYHSNSATYLTIP